MKFTAMGVLLSLILVCSSIYCIWAEAPETPKIVFSSTREGNRDIYLMNPDGTQQVKITNHRAIDTLGVWSPTDDKQVEQLTHIGINFLGDWFDPAFALPVSPQPQLLTTLWGEVKQE